MVCKDEGKQATYVGETARATWQRSGEHLKDATNKEKSHMGAHMAQCHPDETDPRKLFRIAVNRYARTATERQLMEAIQVRNGKGNLNSKTEYTRCLIPTLKTHWRPDDTLRTPVENEDDLSTIEDLLGNRRRRRKDIKKIKNERPMKKRRIIPILQM